MRPMSCRLRYRGLFDSIEYFHLQLILYMPCSRNMRLKMDHQFNSVEHNSGVITKTHKYKNYLVILYSSFADLTSADSSLRSLHIYRDNKSVPSSHHFLTAAGGFVSSLSIYKHKKSMPSSDTILSGH